MAGTVLIGCPNCKMKNSAKRRKCYGCDFSIHRSPQKSWWIDYRDPNGRRVREFIGKYPTKVPANHRLREVQSAITEGRYIRHNKNQIKSLGVILGWYKELAEVKALRKYNDRIQLLDKMISVLGHKVKISGLSLQVVDQYRIKRMANLNPRTQNPYKPATVNRELAYLRAMLNLAVKYGELDSNPISGMAMLDENNVRERVLSMEEFGNLHDECSQHIKPVVLMAFYMGLRKSEILKLTWNEVDLENGFIRLGGVRTKNKEGRVIPIHPDVGRALLQLPSRKVNPWSGRVFLDHRRMPFNDCKAGFNTAVKKAGLGDFTFHDLRHCAVNNLRLANNDHLAIKKMIGHKTNSIFERYNLVSLDEVMGVKWLDQEEKNFKPRNIGENGEDNKN